MRSSPEARLSLGLLTISLSAIAAFLWLGFGPLTSGPVVRGPSLLPSELVHAHTRFVDVTEDVGLGGVVHRDLPEDARASVLSPGIALLDLDRDGDLDLVVLAGSEAPVGVRIFENHLDERDGTFRFEDVTERAGIRWRGAAQGICAGDYDSDSDVDLFVTALGQNLLLRNLLLDDVDRGLHFEDATAAAGLALPEDAPEGRELSTGAMFTDLDVDGHLDLYVAKAARIPLVPTEDTAPATESRAYPALEDAVYRNLGSLNRFQRQEFKDRTQVPPQRSIGALATHLGTDGYPELYVTHEGSPNSAYRLFPGSEGLERKDLAREREIHLGSGSGLAVGDPDDDSDLDLLFANWPVRRPGLLLREDQIVRPRNVRLPQFGEAPNSGGFVTSTTDELFGRGVVFFDYDNDGRLDVVVSNGSSVLPSEDGSAGAQPLQLFRNVGGDRMFQEVGADAGEPFQRRYRGRGLVAGDLDRDGDLDLVLAQNHGPVVVLRNDLDSRARQNSTHLPLTLPLEARYSARADAIGARILVETSDAIQMQEMHSGSSYLSQEPLEFHITLGDSALVDQLTVFLPRFEDDFIRRFTQLLRSEVPKLSSRLRESR